MFVFELSKSGNDVLDGLDPNDLIFSSRFNTFKIIAEGQLLTQTVNSDPDTFSVAHGLGFTPNFYAFAEFPDGKVATPDNGDFTWQPAVDDNGYGMFTCTVDAVNLNFHFTRPGSNYNVNIKYYILEVPL